MREELRVVIVPSSRVATVVARARSRVVLTARLPPIPWDRRAVPMLLEALGAWHSLPVHAALVVGERASSSVTSLYPSWFADFGGDGYALEVVDHPPRRGER
jgi:hypothetical protein